MERLRKKKVVGSSGTCLGRQGQADLYEFENSLVYTPISGDSQGYTETLVSKETKRKSESTYKDRVVSL